MSYTTIARLRALVSDEIGTLRKDAPFRVALVYPSPYHVAMSSLGYQAMYRELNRIDGVACDRAMLPDDGDDGPLLTLERERPVAEYPLVAFSVAYELELPGVLTCLARAGVAPLRDDRRDDAPIIVAGGPLTFSNPVPLAPFCDVIVMGEGEEVGAEVVRRAHAAARKDDLLAELAALPGVYVPAIHGDAPPPVARIADAGLPAVSQILTPHTELSSMFLVEAGRGCSRGCTYCVMRRSTNGGMRAAPPERILAAIPAAARRVGLVGAAVTDHPKIADIVRAIVDGGREVGISSLRADRLTDELVGLLRRGGYRTLTVASDGASERVRALIERKTYERHLLRAAELAKAHGLRTLKVYMMVGVPGEEDADIDELVRFTDELRKVHGRVALGVAPFVAKRNTPLDGTPFAGIPVVEARLDRLRRGLAGRAVVRPTSARWAWVEYMLAQGDARAGLATLDAWRAGGSFAAWKRAFVARDATPTGPRARVPSTAELLAIKRRTVSTTPHLGADAPVTG
jgi:radical SAM superfamily enzyme YgiQ (UPF0313 family)